MNLDALSNGRKSSVSTMQESPVLPQHSSDKVESSVIAAEKLQNYSENLSHRLEEFESCNEAPPEMSSTLEHSDLPAPYVQLEETARKDFRLYDAEDAQSISRYVYRVWDMHVLCLKIQLIIAILLCCLDTKKHALMCGSIKALVLYGPAAYVGWIRPVQRAIQPTTSLNFSIFFFFLMIQFIMPILYLVTFASHTIELLCSPMNRAFVRMDAAIILPAKIYLGLMFVLLAFIHTSNAQSLFQCLVRVHYLYMGTTAARPTKPRTELALSIIGDE